MESKAFRSRFMAVALPLLLLAIFATSVKAQGIFSGAFQGLPFLGGTCAAVDGCTSVVGPMSLDARVGYGRVGLNFNLPVSFGLNLDLSFRDANVWIGSVGARVESCSGLLFALRAQGNAARRIGIETSEQAFDALNWDGSRLQWWTLDGDIGYRISPCFSALVGLRRDQMTVGLSDPRDEFGQPLNDSIVIPGLLDESLVFRGDFSSKHWIPYVGVEITGRHYRASLRYSPIAWADIRIPNTLFLSIFVQTNPTVLFLQGIDFDYKVHKHAQFVEYDFEYDVNVSRNIACRLWSTGSWMQLRGRGNLDALFNLLVSIGGVPVVSVNESDSESGTATYTRTMLSGGIAGVFYF